MALQPIFIIIIFGFFGAIGLLALFTGIYYLFKRRKKLHEMSTSNTSFNLNQSKEVDKKYMNK